MIIEARSRSPQVPAGQAPGRRSTLRRSELLHVMLEEPCDLAVGGQEGGPEIEELLPFVIAVTHGPCVRPAVIGFSGSTTAAQLLLRFANRMTSLSPLIQTCARFARTGSAPSVTWPGVVMTFAFGNSSGMRGSSLAPAVTEKITSSLLRSAAVLNRSALSLWIRRLLPFDQIGPM